MTEIQYGEARCAGGDVWPVNCLITELDEIAGVFSCEADALEQARAWQVEYPQAIAITVFRPHAE